MQPSKEISDKKQQTFPKLEFKKIIKRSRKMVLLTAVQDVLDHQNGLNQKNSSFFEK